MRCAQYINPMVLCQDVHGSMGLTEAIVVLRLTICSLRAYWFKLLTIVGAVIGGVALLAVVLGVALCVALRQHHPVTPALLGSLWRPIATLYCFPPPPSASKCKPHL